MNDFLNITYPAVNYDVTAIDQYIGATGQLIEGSATKTLNVNAGITVVFDGATWKIL